MIARIEDRDKAPAQPMGWRVNAYVNATTQARQETERQRQRVVQLERRNRRLRSACAGALTLLLSVGMALLGIGLVLGFAVGTGLIRAMGQ